MLGPALAPPQTILPRHLAFLAAEQAVFWLDQAGARWPDLGVVRAASLSGDDSEVSTLLDNQNPGAGLAVDWISRSEQANENVKKKFNFS